MKLDGETVDAAKATHRNGRGEAEAAGPPCNRVHSPPPAQLRRQLPANHTGEATSENSREVYENSREVDENSREVSENSSEVDDNPDGVGAGGPHDDNDAAADDDAGGQHARRTRLDIILGKVSRVLDTIYDAISHTPCGWLRPRN